MSIGNLYPMIILIQQNKVDKSTLDSKGYNILHYAVFFGNFNLMKLLVERFGIDPKIKTKT